MAYSQFADTADNISASNSLIKKNINDDNEKPVQYRRGIPLQDGYQSYDEYYQNKNILEEKKKLFPLESTGVWTELNPKVPRVSYLCVDFVGVDTGWAVGELGAIIYTTNGGNKWNTALSGVNNVLLNVNSYDGKTVIVTGYSGIILRSTDAGKSWTQIQSGVTADLWRVQMINDTLGWACGLNNTLLKTTDAGLSWVFINTISTTMHYWAVMFLNANTGYIACGNGNILKTVNGGLNWEIIYVGENIHLFTITVFDTSNFIAGGQRAGSLGRIAYTSDGGNTFGYSNAGGLVESIGFANDTLGYAVGTESVLYRTTNKGRNWEFINYHWVGRFWVKFINDSLGYQAGHGLRINQTTDKGYSWKKSINNENFNDVYFTSEVKGFLIGSDKLYRTNDGGITLEEVSEISGGSNVIFINNFTGFIGRTNGIYKTTNGGETWYLVNGLTGGVIKIFFINETTGWAIGGSNIYKTIDGGENWFVQITLPADNFSSIYFIDSLNGWATSRYIWQTTNGGTNWIQRNDIPAFISRDIYFLNSDTGWTIDNSSFAKLIKTIDGGINWTEISTINDPFEFHFFPDPIHWIISGVGIGGGGYIVHYTYITTDYGNNWVEISNDVPTGFSSFQAPTNTLGFAVGGGGLILRYDDTTYVPVELVSFEVNVENDKVVIRWVTESELNNQGVYIEKSHDRLNWETIAFITGKGTTAEKNYYSFCYIEKGIGEITYRLKQVDFDGTFTYSKIISVSLGNRPMTYELFQNFPNPFNPQTTIKYALYKKDAVNISLYSILGEKITELINEEKQPGVYSIILDSNDLTSGIYFYKLTTGSGYTAVNKLTIIK